MKEATVIGLTGGIACGKTTIARVLRRLGAVIIDADREAKRVIKPRSSAWDKLVRIHGREILNPDGSINRRRLGNKVFGDKEALAQLNNIVHPETMRVIKEKIKDFKNEQRWPAVVLDAPLLFEAGAETLVDVVWVVKVDSETQVNRLINRDGMTEEQALKRIESQMPLEEKVARGDAVIDNTGTRRETREQVMNLWHKYVPGDDNSEKKQ